MLDISAVPEGKQVTFSTEHILEAVASGRHLSTPGSYYGRRLLILPLAPSKSMINLYIISTAETTDFNNRRSRREMLKSEVNTVYISLVHHTCISKR